MLAGPVPFAVVFARRRRGFGFSTAATASAPPSAEPFPAAFDRPDDVFDPASATAAEPSVTAADFSAGFFARRRRGFGFSTAATASAPPSAE
ncbi:MAG: hypothetical protein ACE5EV_05830, partial [Gaiellales bacterium]